MNIQVNLACGQPPENLLPFQLVSSAAIKLLSGQYEMSQYDDSSSPLNYGDCNTFFSKRVASLLHDECGRDSIDYNLIVPTAGVSNALDMICTMLCKGLNKQGIVFVEEATYFLSMGVFEDHGLIIQPVATDDEGIVIDDFRRLLEALGTEGAASLQPLFLYTIPTFHNPTGRTMSLSRRRQLLELTREYGVFVVADEVYQMLGFTSSLTSRKDSLSSTNPNALYPALVSLTPPSSCPLDLYEHVISVSSFSKILAPGLRVGWVEFSCPALAERFRALGVLRSGSSISHFASCVAVCCLSDPTDPDSTHPQCPLRSHMQYLRDTLARKYEALTDALVEYSRRLLGGYGIEDAITITGYGTNEPVGGYFIWVKLPAWLREKYTATDLLSLAREDPYSVAFTPGDSCMPVNSNEYIPLSTIRASESVPREQFVRLCFARLSVEELQDGAQRLCQLLADIKSV